MDEKKTVEMLRQVKEVLGFLEVETNIEFKDLRGKRVGEGQEVNFWLN